MRDRPQSCLRTTWASDSPVDFPVVWPWDGTGPSASARPPPIRRWHALAANVSSMNKEQLLQLEMRIDDEMAMEAGAAAEAADERCSEKLMAGRDNSAR